MQRPVSAVAIILLLAIAVAQAGRAIYGIDVTVAGTPVPMAVSWAVAAVAALLAGGLLWEWSWGRPPAAIAGKDATAAVSKPDSALQDADYESVKIDGRFVPAAYFMFAVKTLPPAAIKEAKMKHGRILVGFDSGVDLPQSGEIKNPSFKAAREVGAELEVYVEGPGGATGTTGWSDDELARVKLAAELVGIDTRPKDWQARSWDTGGWKKYTFRQLENYKRQGFNAGEIDNLERVIKTADARVAFYKEYAALYGADRLPQLIMKNVDEEELRRVVKAIQTNELPRTMFSEFHIFETEKGQTGWHLLDKISNEVGIRTVISTNTYKYATEGKYGLNREFNVAMGQTLEQGSQRQV